MKPIIPHTIVFSNKQTRTSRSGDLIGEEPLSIRIQGKPYSVVMRTPGAELAHVAGFCLGEGIVETPEDILELAFCDGDDTNVVTVTLSDTRQKSASDHMERRQFISQTSCGLCGKELVEELIQVLEPVKKDVRVSAQNAVTLINGLSVHQPLREKTRAAHAAALFDSEGRLLSVAEDVGRHNALDKAIGALFLDHRLATASVLVLSSRISYELVQKAARAKIPIILAVSKPTSLAVSLAEELGMTLACGSEKEEIAIYSGAQRIS